MVSLPRYDYLCKSCAHQFEGVAKIDERNDIGCPKCESPCEIQLTGFFHKRSDAPYFKDFNGFINDMDQVKEGKQEYIETRDQYRAAVEREYSDPHPNVQAVKKEYLDRV